MDKHTLIVLVKRLAEELGRNPTHAEFGAAMKGAHYQLKIHFNNKYGDLIKAAGLDPVSTNPYLQSKMIIKDEKNLRDYKKLCAKKTLLHSFVLNQLDIKDLFERAGNPSSLKAIFTPDTHAKFKDNAAWRCHVKFIKYFSPDIHFFMGDLADCEALSHWPPNSLEPRRIVPELKITRKLIQEVVEASPECSTRVFLCGNHEDWINQAFTKMPELFDGLQDLDIDLSVSSLLGLQKFGYEFYPVNEIVQIGEANFTHGIYVGSGHPKKHLDTFKANIFYGHAHDSHNNNQTSMDGELTAQSLACLCRLDAAFLKGKPNNWHHGFGVFEFFPDGKFVYHVQRIINGKTSFNGQVFDGNEESL